jgi:hypothetical protein
MAITAELTELVKPLYFYLSKAHLTGYTIIYTLIKNAPLLDLIVTKYEVISGDLSHSQSSVNFHNFESDVVSNFNPSKTNTE